MTTTDDRRHDLVEEFERASDFRRSKAIEYPQDERNGQAVTILTNLASSAFDVEAAKVLALYELFDDCTDAEIFNDLIRAVGFSYFPRSADEFVGCFIAKVTSGNPPPPVSSSESANH